MDFRRVAVWAAVIFVATVLFLTGVGTITQPGPWQRQLAAWSLPPWLVPLIGLAEMTAAAIIVRVVWRRRRNGH